MIQQFKTTCQTRIVLDKLPLFKTQLWRTYLHYEKTKNNIHRNQKYESHSVLVHQFSDGVINEKRILCHTFITHQTTPIIGSSLNCTSNTLKWENSLHRNKKILNIWLGVLADQFRHFTSKTCLCAIN